MSTIDTHAPMELLGVQPGISVIDPSTVLARLWYFDGKFLRAEGFRRDQEYVRSLVALSNQAVGAGLVHGFRVTRAGGELHVSGGLALAPSGRVVFLPGDVDLSVAQLVARSSGELDPGVAPTPGHADFGVCAPDEVIGDDMVTTAPPRPIYVLTVAPAEALCGEEERFGQLCEDACATETDRSLAVEGVRFRVRLLDLSLPTSAQVTFDDRHLRSRVATAFFERERSAVPSMISGAGLRSDVWCRVAPGIGGDEVALAVFERGGSVVTWLDTWTARRELVEMSPQRYWGWRLAQRPLDVFLAQLLQFQCQLIDGLADPGGGDGPDPCEERRAALVEVDQVLGALGDQVVLDRLVELRERVTAVLAGTAPTTTGSVLLDRGIVTLPPGGYLPVDPTRSVEEQVRALMGPGVDLRFCAVRPDFVPEALQEAQHMERISLTRGIDDPAAVEEVDVLVPGGVVERRPADRAAFEGRVRILPATRRDPDGVTSGSVLTLSAVAREHVGESWSWSVAAHGEAPHRLAVADLASTARVTTTDPAAAASFEPLYVERDVVHEAVLNDPAFRLRLNREAVFARERVDRNIGVFAPDDPAFEVAADRPIPRDEKRPFALWFDVEIGSPLTALEVGQSATVRARGTAYSRAATEPFLVDAQLAGQLVVTAKRARTSTGGRRVWEIDTAVNGAIDLLRIAGAEVEDPTPVAIRRSLRWFVAEDAARSQRLLAVEMDMGKLALRVELSDVGDPRRIEGALTLGLADDDAPDVYAGAYDGEWQPATHLSVGATAVGDSASTRQIRYGDLVLDESPGALDVGSPGRDLGEAVIEVIGAELAVRGRDDGFMALARRRLLEGDEPDGGSITGTADWVMFHRRRTKDCGGPVERPTAVRRLRWYHAVVDDPKEGLARFEALAGRWMKASRARSDVDAVRVRERVDQLGFEPVTVVEFAAGSTTVLSSRVAIRAAWSAGSRGDALLLGVAASPPNGDGAAVDLGRLDTVVSVVGDLVDASAIRTSTIAEIPPEFAAPGIDGVLFTVGTARPEVRTRSALLVRYSGGGQGGDIEGPEVTRLELARAFGGLDAVTATWEDGTFANSEEVREWWGSDEGAHAVYLATRQTADDPTTETRVADVGTVVSFLSVQEAEDYTWVDDETDLLVVLVPRLG